jgi:hypothetical protein
MIQDISASLRALLTQPGLPDALKNAQIVFDRPDESFAARQSTIDLYAYSIRKNRDLGIETGTFPISCTYLITAWPAGGTELALDEQRLLGEVLQLLARYPAIPAAFLQGGLKGRGELPQLVLLPGDALKDSSEFWTALGGRLRPSLTVTVMLSVPAVPAAP